MLPPLRAAEQRELSKQLAQEQQGWERENSISMDRLGELRMATSLYPHLDNIGLPAGGAKGQKAERTKSRDLEKGRAPSPALESSSLANIEGMIAQKQEIKTALTHLTASTDELVRLHREALATTDLGRTQELSRQGAALTRHCSETLEGIRKTLGEMESYNKRLQGLLPPGASDLRLRAMQHRQLAVAFRNALKRYYEVQSDFGKQSRKLLLRQYDIVNPRASAVEKQHFVEELEKSGGNAVVSSLFAVAVREDAQRELARMKARAEDMQSINTACQDLARLFLDLDVMIEEQGLTIDKIESNVRATAEYNEQSKKKLESAVEYQKQSQMYKWIIAAVVILLCLLALAYIWRSIK